MIFTTTDVPMNPEVTGALFEAARTARGRQVDDSHFMGSLIRVGAVSHALAACGVDVPKARAGIEAAIAALPKRPWYSVDVTLADPMREVAAMALAAGLPEVTGPYMFARLAERAGNAAVAAALNGAGFSLLAFRRQIAHGAVVDPPCPEQGPVRVVLHNDPFTTMAFVVAVLRDVFGRDEATASALMMRIHREGSAALATMDAAEARTKLAATRARAEEIAMPLRVTVAAA